MRIAIDVMGGDHAPDAILSGALDALTLLNDQDQLVLVGDLRIIEDGVTARDLSGDARIEIEPATQIIAMDETPVTALRAKPDSSLVRMAELGKRRAGARRCDVIISAGNTGATVAAAQMSMRRLPGVHRPCIAVPLPTFSGYMVLCDAGANPEPKPTHLHQYGHMGAIYSNRVLERDQPRVALLSIGGEEGKGNMLTRETHQLFKNDKRLNYIGYVEGRDLFEDRCDVVVTEGFTGNVVLKLIEGLSSGIFRAVAREFQEGGPQMVQQFGAIVKKIYAKHDYHEYGGAPLLGANGICLICHGSSEARTIVNAVRAARRYYQYDLNDGIVEALGTCEGVV